MTSDPAARPHTIVLGNEKGGTGKSTTALHVIVGLLRDGRRVGAIDIDARQGTTSRFFQRRRDTAARQGLVLPMPVLEVVRPSALPDRAAAATDEEGALKDALARLSAKVDVVVIDTPGSDTTLGRAAHARADTLITPLNDSFVDLDLLATVDPETLEIVSPSIYAELVWEQRKRRAIADGGSVDWIVMRNRLSALDARNKRDMADLLARLSRRIGFRLIDGFGERVIFRELFLRGLTLLDLQDTEQSLTFSQVAARQEVRGLLQALELDSERKPRRSYLG